MQRPVYSAQACPCCQARVIRGATYCANCAFSLTDPFEPLPVMPRGRPPKPTKPWHLGLLVAVAAIVAVCIHAREWMPLPFLLAITGAIYYYVAHNDSARYEYEQRRRVLTSRMHFYHNPESSLSVPIPASLDGPLPMPARNQPVEAVEILRRDTRFEAMAAFGLPELCRGEDGTYVENRPVAVIVRQAASFPRTRITPTLLGPALDPIHALMGAEPEKRLASAFSIESADTAFAARMIDASLAEEMLRQPLWAVELNGPAVTVWQTRVTGVSLDKLMQAAVLARQVIERAKAAEGEGTGNELLWADAPEGTGTELEAGAPPEGRGTELMPGEAP